MTPLYKFSVPSCATLGFLGLLLVGCGGKEFEPPARCIGSECGPGACTVGEETYKSGTMGIPAADGCNTCSCDDGQLSCTERACGNPCAEETTGALRDPVEAPKMPMDDCNSCRCEGGQMVCTDLYCPSTCEQDGIVYQNGEQVGGADECGNTCTCNDGNIACTLRDCSGGCFYAGGTVEEGKSFPSSDGCNTCTCLGGNIACTMANCPPTEGACLTDAECKDGELCARPMGLCGGEGKCTPKPEGCSEVFAPVCGCDGVTYTAGECSAQAQGMNVAYFGECVAQPVPCLTNANCGQNEFCDQPVGFCSVQFLAAQGADEPAPDSDAALRAPVPPGTCRPRPDVCTDEENLVCGCDGVTYGNPCAAATAGVSVASAGACL